MKKIISLLLVLTTYNSIAQNPIAIPDTLTGTTFYLNMHIDSVQFLPGIKTHTNAYNQYSYLGPTLILNKGDLVTMNVTDNIGDTTTVHWHGLHVPAMDDGGPHTYILPGNTLSPQFTVMNNASTFWYHPHLHTKTAQQVMRGAAGLIIVRDTIEANLNLPRQYGIDDFPLIIQSQQFDVNNQIEWRGMHDSILLVNGITDPMLSIPAQVVRLRLLNAAQERNFNFGFTANHPFYVIGNDGGLLNAPVSVTRIRLSPGERAEVLIDLSGMQGQNMYLMSYASEFPMGVQGGTPMPGMDTAMYSPINGINFNILHLDIVPQTTNPVTSIPVSLVTVTPWLQSQSNITRQITITAQNMMSMDGPFFFNGNLFDMHRIDYHIPLNNIEIWSLSNQTMVAHPFHIHDVQFFVLDRDGVSVQPYEAGYKDVVMIAPQETVRFITKFEDFADASMPYMYHCHILMHEDDGMMGSFVVVDSTSIGVTEIENIKIKVYPNPGDEYIDITYDEGPVLSFTKFVVSDVMGRVIIPVQTIINQNTIRINTSDLAAGLYMMSIESDKINIVRKLIITHN